MNGDTTAFVLLGVKGLKQVNKCNESLSLFPFFSYLALIRKVCLKYLLSREGFAVWSNHRVLILNRGSMFAFQWREFSPPLSSAHRLLQCYHSQWEIRDAAIPGEFPISPPPLGSLANERAIPCDVTLWRCTFWSGKFASLSSLSLARHAPSI